MQNSKEVIVIPFLPNLKNEDAKANTTSIASGDSEFNVNSLFVRDEEIKDEFILSLYDELIIPIDVIYGAAQLMEMYQKYIFGNDEKTDKSINSMKQNCLRLTRLINNLLDLTRIEANQYSLNLSNVNIVEVVESIVFNSSFIINERQLNVIFDSNVEEKVILCDAEKIERVVLHILSETIKLSKPGETIIVRVNSKDYSVEIAVSNEDKKINEKDKLNDTYAKANKIDFLLFKSIVELHGGLLDNKVNEENKITIELPCNNNDSIYFLNYKKSDLNHENLLATINIELSDLINMGWK
ncbi:MAG: histidine kinase dimerization/phospho-acceptor domain-containing protein [Sedimentibacter sp.]|uniref:sensor histidine kinase n=1 Tax=Sedimentibacter sp. TaxID=1960295 RepID=UPI00298276E5|nr:histidine kinase dimerization/phospho-acceptor domain-containing protein [Sedimentibacter sp.]MDW5299179.1 histidine kinase dimerization/phospho-acceptor domain-containing protein [Sedimentibacter sp.]